MIFASDICGYAVMSNHLHMVLRARPDLVRDWSFQLDRYLSILDWTSRQLWTVSRGTIPAQLAPILERLSVNGDGWVETVGQFGRWFKTAAGRRDSLVHLAA